MVDRLKKQAEQSKLAREKKLMLLQDGEKLENEILLTGLPAKPEVVSPKVDLIDKKKVKNPFSATTMEIAEVTYNQLKEMSTELKVPMKKLIEEICDYEKEK